MHFMCLLAFHSLMCKELIETYINHTMWSTNTNTDTVHDTDTNLSTLVIKIWENELIEYNQSVSVGHNLSSEVSVILNSDHKPPTWKPFPWLNHNYRLTPSSWTITVYSLFVTFLVQIDPLHLSTKN